MPSLVEKIMLLLHCVIFVFFCLFRLILSMIFIFIYFFFSYASNRKNKTKVQFRVEVALQHSDIQQGVREILLQLNNCQKCLGERMNRQTNVFTLKCYLC